MQGLEGFVDSRAEGRFAARVARVAQHSRIQFGEQITSAREKAADAAWHYRQVLAEVLDKRQRGRAVPKALQARLDAALVEMDRANDAVSALLAPKVVAA